MAVAPASVVVLVAVFGQSPEVVSPVAPRPVPKLLAPLPAPRPPADEDIVLRPAGDGSGDLVYEGNGIRARVAPDGSVALRGEPGDTSPQREAQDNPDRQS
jgi:hypothetical protein